MRTLRCYLLASLSLLLVAGSAWAGSVTPTSRVTRYVVVRKGPSKATASVGQLKPGETAESLESAGRWLKIRLSNGTEGYVSKGWVTESGQPAAGVARVGPPILYPDPAMTPGVTNPDITQANIDQTICNPHWSTKSIRPPTSYTNSLKKTQLIAYGDTVPDASRQCFAHSSDPHCYEEDHLISLELGGHPRDAKNLWPEPYNPSPGAKQKDTVENFLHKQVCAGAMTLEEAQKKIATDWYAVYQSMHH